MPTIDQFRTLLALQQNDFSVTETARSIGTSQPGVSRRILALEMELGVELLQRRGRHIQGFSPIGEQVADNANNLLRSLENLTKLAADYHSEEVGELNVVTTHTQARYALPRSSGSVPAALSGGATATASGTAGHHGQHAAQR